MANFTTVNTTTDNSTTDLYLIRQSGIDYKQTREALAASIANARWSETFDYDVGSEVIASDGERYYALVANGANNGGSVDPTDASTSGEYGNDTWGWINRDITATVEALQDTVEAMKVPVGGVYIMSGVSTNPADFLLYGTWTAFGAGQVLVGVGTFEDTNGDSITWDDGDTAGEYNHTITADEMASHSHTFSGTSSSSGAHTHSYELSRAYDESSYPGNYIGYGQNETVKSPISGKIYSAGAHTHTYSGTTSSVGGDTAMNNMQPTIAVYMWLRTA